MKNILIYLTLFVFASLNSVNGQIINTIIGSGILGFSGDGGKADTAKLNTPISIAFDAIGNTYVSDFGNNRIRKINTLGIITTIAGNGTAGYGGDGGPAISAEIDKPYWIATDKYGNLYIADFGNSRVRKVNTSGIITTVAGSGTTGYSGDGGQAALAGLYEPSAIALDTIGNLYIADEVNNRIRKVDTLGVISTIAGNGTQGINGDGGQAIAAELYFPDGLAFDKFGNLYIGDSHNGIIRKIDASGIITKVAGNGTTGYSGDGGPAINAEFYSPFGLTFDGSNNLYIADQSNNRIRQVNSLGVINTFVGNGTIGNSGDGGLATAAELHYPYGINIDPFDNMYIADAGNHRVRIVNNISEITEQKRIDQINVFPNPTSDQFYIETNTTDKLNLDLYDVNGRHVFSASVSDKSNINVTTLNAGVYSLLIKTADHVINKKLVILR